MKKYILNGESLRAYAKFLVIDFMSIHPDCNPNATGLTQAEIFRACGLDWDNQESATSSQQQYWLVALLRTLESDGLIERVRESGPWRLK